MVQQKSYSYLLQELVQDHYNHVLSFRDYRDSRRNILNAIDESFNGVRICADDQSDVHNYQEQEARNLGDTLTMRVDEIFESLPKEDDHRQW